MRSLFVLFLLLALLPEISPHSRASASEPNKSIYFLVDVSGSMQHRWLDAEIEISKQVSVIANQHPEAMISRTEFRAKSDSDCSDEIAIVDPVPLALLEEPQKERTFATDDYSPLGSALLAAITHAKMGPAEIFLVSDWAQSPGCGVTIEDAIQSVDPDADIAITPIIIRANDADLVLAKEASRSRFVVISDVSNAPTNTNGVGVPKLRTEVYGPPKSFSLKWLFVPLSLIFFGASVVIFLTMALRKNEAIASQESEPKQKHKAIAAWTSAAFSFGFLALALILFSDAQRAQFPFLYQQMNGRLLSGLILNLMLGFVGWSLIQVWGINEFRQKTANRKYIKELEETRRNQRLKDREDKFQANDKPKLERKRVYATSKVENVKQRRLLMYQGPLEESGLLALSKKVARVEQNLERLVEKFFAAAKRDDRQTLSAFLNASRQNYSEVADLLVEQSLLDEKIAIGANEVLAAWEQILDGDRSEVAEYSRLIEQFNADTIA